MASKDAVTATRRKQAAGNGLALGICDGLVVGKHDGKITTTRKRRLELKWALKLVNPDLFAVSSREKFHARAMWDNHGFPARRSYVELRQSGSRTLSYGEATWFGMVWSTTLRLMASWLRPANGGPNRRQRANARRSAATTGDGDGTGKDNRAHARTARATKRAGNRTQRPDTETAGNPGVRAS